MTTGIKSSVQEIYNTLADFPFNLIIQKFFNTVTDDKTNSDEDDDIINCAIRYYDAKHEHNLLAMDQERFTIRELLQDKKYPQI